jgi:hypothetical protein
MAVPLLMHWQKPKVQHFVASLIIIKMEIKARRDWPCASTLGIRKWPSARAQKT